MFGNYEKFIDKFNTCARTRPFDKQILDYTFYAKEHTKPLFISENILTVHNLYVYHCLLEIIKLLKLRTPIGLCSFLNVSARKPTLIITSDPSNGFFYKSGKLWNVLKSHILEGSTDFSIKFNNTTYCPISSFQCNFSFL